MANRPRLPRRHPAEVTSDRLGQHYADWYDILTPHEREAISRVRDALENIAAAAIGPGRG